MDFAKKEEESVFIYLQKNRISNIYRYNILKLCLRIKYFFECIILFISYTNNYNFRFLVYYF